VRVRELDASLGARGRVFEAKLPFFRERASFFRHSHSPQKRRIGAETRHFQQS
jgi:hypothetical protein